MFALGLEFRLAKLVALAPDRGAHGPDPVQRHGVARLRGGAGVRLDGRWRAPSPERCSPSPAPRSSPRRSTSSGRRQAARDRGRHPDRRGSDRGPADGGADGRSRSGAALSAGELALTTARLLGFLAGVLAAGLLIVPAFMRAIVRLGRPETTLIASIGVCFGVALPRIVRLLGRARRVRRGLAGRGVGEGEEVEHLVAPVRDIFAAIFFVSVGMLIDPACSCRYALPIAVLTLVVIVGKILRAWRWARSSPGAARASRSRRA